MATINLTSDTGSGYLESDFDQLKLLINGEDTGDLAANTTHRSSDGKNHSDVVLNNTHRGTVTGNPHNVLATQITDFDTEVSNNSSVTANTAKVTNATHTGEVTGFGGSDTLVISDNVVDEANLKLDTAPTNDYVLTADSTASGGMKWAAAGAGGSGTAYTVERKLENDVFPKTFMQIPITDELNGKDVKEVRISLGGLPTGQAFKVDVRKNGLATTDSIFTSDTEIEIGTSQTATNGIYQCGCDISGSTVGTSGTTIDSARDTLASDDVLFVVITQVGSTIKGSDFVCQMVIN